VERAGDDAVGIGTDRTERPVLMRTDPASPAPAALQAGVVGLYATDRLAVAVLVGHIRPAAEKALPDHGRQLTRSAAPAMRRKGHGLAAGQRWLVAVVDLPMAPSVFPCPGAQKARVDVVMVFLEVEESAVVVLREQYRPGPGACTVVPIVKDRWHEVVATHDRRF
jgi:hypothetical protein